MGAAQLGEGSQKGVQRLHLSVVVGQKERNKAKFDNAIFLLQRMNFFLLFAKDKVFTCLLIVKLD